MSGSIFTRAAACAMFSLIFAVPASAQDRNALRNQARQSAAELRALGEPMDRCAFGSVIQQRRVIELLGASPFQLGDSFTHFNGVDVSSMSDEQIVALARGIGPNEHVSVAVERGSEALTLEVQCSNARAYMQPLLTALDQAARGRFSDCFETLAAADDSSSLKLRLQCALHARGQDQAAAGNIAHRLAMRAVEIAWAIPERRPDAIALLRSSEAMITSARGASAFRGLVDATRTWPGDETAWDRSEPDWGAFRRNAEAALRRRLIDPESARIEWPNGFTLGSWRPGFSSPIEGYWTCGLINARNRMGGYTGSTAFVVVLSPEGQVRYADLGASRDFDVITMQCSNSIRLLPPPPAALTTQAAATSGAGGPSPSIADELERLVRLRDSGALTPAEFDAAKDRLLGAQ